MDLTPLEPLGKIAGVGGIAIGAAVLISRAVIAKTSSVSARQRAATLRLVAIGAIAIGALGIIAWVANSWSGGLYASTRGDDSPAVISGGSVTIKPAAPAAGSNVPPPQLVVSPNATVKTQGNRSPAIVSGGDAVVSPPMNLLRPNSP